MIVGNMLRYFIQVSLSGLWLMEISMEPMQQLMPLMMRRNGVITSPGSNVEALRPPSSLPQTFEEVEWTPWYDTQAPIPPNAQQYLSTCYGEDWTCVAINKCNKPDGGLYKMDPRHCDMPCYAGAHDYPLRTCGSALQRGPTTASF